MPNMPQYLIAAAAIWRAGLVLVNVNPLLTAPELERELGDSGAQALFIVENAAHVAAMSGANPGQACGAGGRWRPAGAWSILGLIR